MVDLVKLDSVVIGAGVIGLATAAKIGASLVLEKSSSFGQGISTRNSQVIHAGFYYPPTSLKTKLCIRGSELLRTYLKQYSIPHKITGKWVVGDSEADLIYLEGIHKKANGLGIPLRFLSSKEMKAEPFVSSKHALFSPQTGIFDAHSFMKSLTVMIPFFINKEQASSNGTLFMYNSKVESIIKSNNDYILTVKSGNEEYKVSSPIVINAAGLYATEIAHLLIPDYPYTTKFCQGRYFQYTGKGRASTLIYPIPDRQLASLGRFGVFYVKGIHLTLGLDHSIKFGPDDCIMNENIEDYSMQNAYELTGIFGKSIRKYFPSLDDSEIQPDYMGIRPKAFMNVERVNDFIVQEETKRGFSGFVNCVGIDSPGLTSSLAIAEHIEGILLR